jgi:Cellulose binding domain/Fibronectin type III domain
MSRRRMASCVLGLGLAVVGSSPAQAATIAAPGAPAISRLTAISALVSWTPSSSPDATMYILLTQVNGEWTAVGVSGFRPDTLTSMNVKLQPSTTYTYAVIAEDNNGHQSARSPSTTFTTPPRDTALACQVNFYGIVLGSGFFYANVWLANTSTFIVSNGWTMTFSFPGDERITASTVFGAIITQTGQNVTVTNNPWNVMIDAFGQTGFGFQGTFTGTFVKPNAFSVNGAACSVV